VTVHTEERDVKVGLKGLETCPVSFHQTPVPESSILSGVGKGSEIVMKIFEDQV
jgi:alkylation response protein AidB-like acyl-CoA dehydrogenase